MESWKFLNTYSYSFVFKYLPSLHPPLPDLSRMTTETPLMNPPSTRLLDSNV
ncbi:Hypothetical protein FKW44_012516 [Caligus rogercresseyi]|uniref:Uncharacterized protein n=1 Tax=Caligus rogercresseyi TaxID=217165 RepID=A0A7T8HJL4_CALRO|nr:Hypothetical protein FKW44_012516 [Caligus rogercresseyi]